MCPTLCDPIKYSPPGSSVHGISQARILEWVAMPFSRGSSQVRNWTRVSCVAGEFFTTVPQGKPPKYNTIYSCCKENETTRYKFNNACIELIYWALQNTEEKNQRRLNIVKVWYTDIRHLISTKVYTKVYPHFDVQIDAILIKIPAYRYRQDCSKIYMERQKN